MDKVWFSGFKYHVNLVCHAQHIFTHLISTQSSVRVSIVTQDFSATNFKIFKRKNRREVFGVSSENILHLTFCSLQKWRIISTKVTKYYWTFNMHKTFWKALNPPFLQTAVICCAIYSARLVLWVGVEEIYSFFERCQKWEREKLFCNLGFCVGWCGLQMCFFLCGGRWFSFYFRTC